MEIRNRFIEKTIFGCFVLLSANGYASNAMLQLPTLEELQEGCSGNIGCIVDLKNSYDTCRNQPVKLQHTTVGKEGVEIDLELLIQQSNSAHIEFYSCFKSPDGLRYINLDVNITQVKKVINKGKSW